MKFNFKDDHKLLEQIKKHEGIRLKPYNDTEGYLTIGIGRNLSQNGITMLEAELMCLHDIGSIEAELDSVIPWWREMSYKRQMVLVDMGFNLGLTKLLKFEQSLGLMRAGHFDAAASELLHSKWAKQVGTRAQTLFNMMKNG